MVSKTPAKQQILSKLCCWLQLMHLLIVHLHSCCIYIIYTPRVLARHAQPLPASSTSTQAQCPSCPQTRKHCITCSLTNCNNEFRSFKMDLQPQNLQQRTTFQGIARETRSFCKITISEKNNFRENNYFVSDHVGRAI